MSGKGHIFLPRRVFNSAKKIQGLCATTGIRNVIYAGVIILTDVSFYLLNLLVILFLISTDVAEEDADADCRSLAVQSLVLLDKSLKKQLQGQQALGLES